MIKKWSYDLEIFSEARQMDCIDEFYGVPAVHSKRRAVHQKMHTCLFFFDFQFIYYYITVTVWTRPGINKVIGSGSMVIGPRPN